MPPQSEKKQIATNKYDAILYRQTKSLLRLPRVTKYKLFKDN